MIGAFYLMCLLLLQITLADYASLCDSVFCRVLKTSQGEVLGLRQRIDRGSLINDLGYQMDQISNKALEQFAKEASTTENSQDNEEIFEKKVDELDRILDFSLYSVYARQLNLLRERALAQFQQTARSEGSEFEAVEKATESFRSGIESSIRSSGDWEFARDVAHLKNSLTEAANRAKQVTEVKLLSAKNNQQAMQYLQMQQQQLQAIQNQMQGANSPWNVGFAYRIPDTNINLNCNYQQGRGSIQMSCVPDEAMSLLGPNGFVNGVTPGNLGVSFNVNI